jgi:hypothetical protein
MTTDTTSADQFGALRQTLQGLLIQCGPDLDNHDKVNVLISACLSEGIDTGTRIVEMISGMGFDSSHVRILLRVNIGRLWRRNAEGRYTDLPV